MKEIIYAPVDRLFLGGAASGYSLDLLFGGGNGLPQAVRQQSTYTPSPGRSEG